MAAALKKFGGISVAPLAFALAHFVFCVPIATADENTAARLGTEVSVGARAGDFLGGITGAGLEVLLHSDDAAWQFGAIGMVGTRDVRRDLNSASDGSTSLTKALATGQLFEAEARHFFGSTFYATGGLGLRRIAYDLSVDDAIDSGSVTINAKATSLSLSLTVGNVWAWPSGFFLGADWLGVTVPLTNSYSSTVSTSGSASTAAEDLGSLADAGARALGRALSTRLLVLNVGWAF